jgi:transcriptional regulator with XRE-family HTH domain
MAGEPDADDTAEEWEGASAPYDGTGIEAQMHDYDGLDLYGEPDESGEHEAAYERYAAGWRQLGFTLGQARQRLGLSKREAARRANLSDGAWRHLEAGSKQVYGKTVFPNPRPENLVAAAKAVGLPPAKLFDLVGQKPPAELVGPTAEQDLAAEIAQLRPADRELVERLIFRLSRGL